MKFPDETARPPKDSISGVFHFISSRRECDLIGLNEESFANAKATYLAPHPPSSFSITVFYCRET